MSSEQPEDIDYEPEVQKLKKVWDDMQKPIKKQPIKPEAKTQTNTLSKFQKETQQKKLNQKKGKVIVSDQNLKNTVRNPKQNPHTVIEVVTKPHKIYQNAINNQKNNIPHDYLILTQPPKQVSCEVEELRKNIFEKDHELSLLRVSNTHNEDKIRRLESMIEMKDQQIETLKNRQRQLTRQMTQMNSKQFDFNYGKVEYQNFKNDSRRLLKMLKNTQQYQQFANFAIDDNGVRFLNNANKTNKTKLDTPANQNHFHFCTCNKEFIPEPFLWVPEKTYEFGKQFIKSRNGELSQTELQLLLYELNKLWREREKRIINNLTALNSNEIGKYKRKLQNISREKNKSKNSHQQ